MARKRKKPQRSRGFLWLVLAVCVACLGYEPLAQTLQVGLPETLPAFVERIKDRMASSSPSAPAASLSGGKDVLLPAPLKQRPEKILERRTYTVSYNTRLNLPNWVAWELNRERLVERESRTDKFLPDPDLPPAQAVTTDDYKGSGYDRGHMCPAADNRWHWRAMRESFYMTNICPQNHNLNRGDWKELEDACRDWAQRDGSIYIVCGPILYNRKHKVIGREHRVTVPEAFFKVVLSLAGGKPKAIGFIYKNTSGNRPLDSYVNTVDQVERITGMDFFPGLPDEVEREVESRYDLSLWPM